MANLHQPGRRRITLHEAHANRSTLNLTVHVTAQSRRDTKDGRLIDYRSESAPNPADKLRLVAHFLYRQANRFQKNANRISTRETYTQSFGTMVHHNNSAPDVTSVTNIHIRDPITHMA